MMDDWTPFCALGRHRKDTEEARQCTGYIKTNRHRLRYPDFEAKKLCTPSAVVESGCKLVVASRFKGSGMHWSVSGANDILALRGYRLSGRFEDFWERQSQRLGC